MNLFERRVAIRVFALHGGLVICLASISSIRGCHRDTLASGTPTVYEFQLVTTASAQPVATRTVSPQIVESDPPETAASVPSDSSVEVEPRPDDRRRTYVRPEDIVLGPRVSGPPEPALTESEIDRVFSGWDLPSGEAVSSDHTSYDSLLHAVFHRAWSQPDMRSGQPAEVTISISPDGRVLSWRLSRTSGNAQIDATVERAVRSVGSLPGKPPAGYPLDNIVVRFSIH